MSGIKRDDHQNIKTITFDSVNSNLKVEAFANLNDAIDFSLHVGADSSDDAPLVIPTVPVPFSVSMLILWPTVPL